jgi:hypothetical protein
VASPTDATRSRSLFRKWLVVAIGVLVALAIAGLIFGLVRNDEGSSATKRAPNTAPLFGARDDFARSDSSRSLGLSGSGQAWVAVAGVWGVKDNAAYIAVPRSKGYSIAVLNMRTGDGAVQVNMPKVVAGTGLVFRYGNLLNYWSITASPKVGTWNVQKVVGGTSTNLGGIGLARVGDGTTINVSMHDSVIDVSVNGRLQKSFLDGDLQMETRVGFLGFGKPAGQARWSDFTASGQAREPLSPVTTAPPPSSSEPTTTTSTR